MPLPQSIDLAVRAAKLALASLAVAMLLVGCGGGSGPGSIAPSVTASTGAVKVALLLPLTGSGVIDMVITDLGVFAIDKAEGLMVLVELADDVSLDEIKELADLPSREGLLSMLLSVLQAPMRNFALAVKAVADKEGGEDQAQEA